MTAPAVPAMSRAEAVQAAREWLRQQAANVVYLRWTHEGTRVAFLAAVTSGAVRTVTGYAVITEGSAPPEPARLAAAVTAWAAAFELLPADCRAEVLEVSPDRTVTCIPLTEPGREMAAADAIREP